MAAGLLVALPEHRVAVTLDPLSLAHDPTLLAWSQHMLAEGMAAATRKVRVGTVRNVCRWAGVVPLGLAVAHVTSWLAAGNYAPWTRRKYLEHVRCFAGFAGIPDPTAGLRPPPHPRGLPRPVSEADLGRLLAAAVGPERAWVLLGAFCGLRSAETAKVRDVDVLNGATGRLLRVHGKAGREDVLPIPPVVDVELDEWLPWASYDGDGRLWHASAHTVQQRIRRAGERAGVRVTSHQLRHRYGTQLYRQSRDLLMVQRLMRHSSPAAITQIYVELDDTEARQLALALPGASATAGGPGQSCAGAGESDDDT